MTTLDTAPSRIERVATLVTDVLAPAYLVITLLIAVGGSTGSSVATGIGWGFLAALFCGVIPFGFILIGVRRGRLTDQHVGRREQRIVPLGFAVASVIVGLIALWVLDAPRDLIALVVAMLAGLIVTISVTVKWKVSVHTAVAAGTVVILCLVFGWICLLAAPIVVAIAWSRVTLRDHTLAQVTVGAILGGAVAATVFSLLT